MEPFYRTTLTDLRTPTFGIGQCVTFSDDFDTLYLIVGAAFQKGPDDELQWVYEVSLPDDLVERKPSSQKATAAELRAVQASTKHINSLVRNVLIDIISTHKPHALPLLNAILQRAECDPHYATILEAWIETGGTVMLRDELCAPFQDDENVVESLEIADPDRNYPFFDAFTAIDSAGLHARAAERQIYV